jgi:hypothetical protein
LLVIAAGLAKKIVASIAALQNRGAALSRDARL